MKKLLNLILCSTLFLSLTACGSEKLENTDSKNENGSKNVGILTEKILNDNKIIETEVNLQMGIADSNEESGLYKSTDTNNEDPTYYFRGNVLNNYVDFANMKWRVIRINEDGTVRLLLNDFIKENDAAFYIKYNEEQMTNDGMYYSNSDVKKYLDAWFNKNLDKYKDKIAKGKYFCEQARVVLGYSNETDDIAWTYAEDYIPTFKCETDTNGYGLVDTNIALITYDEANFAGSYLNNKVQNSNNGKLYLPHSTAHFYWTMSPAGKIMNDYFAWQISASGDLMDIYAINDGVLHPVINLKANLKASGNGTENDPYIIQ